MSDVKETNSASVASYSSAASGEKYIVNTLKGAPTGATKVSVPDTIPVASASGYNPTPQKSLYSSLAKEHVIERAFGGSDVGKGAFTVREAVQTVTALPTLMMSSNNFKSSLEEFNRSEDIDYLANFLNSQAGEAATGAIFMPSIRTDYTSLSDNLNDIVKQYNERNGLKSDNDQRVVKLELNKGTTEISPLESTIDSGKISFVRADGSRGEIDLKERFKIKDTSASDLEELLHEYEGNRLKADRTVQSNYSVMQGKIHSDAKLTLAFGGKSSKEIETELKKFKMGKESSLDILTTSAGMSEDDIIKLASGVSKTTEVYENKKNVAKSKLGLKTQVIQTVTKAMSDSDMMQGYRIVTAPVYAGRRLMAVTHRLHEKSLEKTATKLHSKVTTHTHAVKDLREAQKGLEKGLQNAAGNPVATGANNLTDIQARLSKETKKLNKYTGKADRFTTKQNIKARKQQGRRSYQKSEAKRMAKDGKTLAKNKYRANKQSMKSMKKGVRQQTRLEKIKSRFKFFQKDGFIRDKAAQMLARIGIGFFSCSCACVGGCIAIAGGGFILVLMLAGSMGGGVGQSAETGQNKLVFEQGNFAYLAEPETAINDVLISADGVSESALSNSVLAGVILAASNEGNPYYQSGNYYGLGRWAEPEFASIAGLCAEAGYANASPFAEIKDYNDWSEEELDAFVEAADAAEAGGTVYTEDNVDVEKIKGMIKAQTFAICHNIRNNYPDLYASLQNADFTDTGSGVDLVLNSGIFKGMNQDDITKAYTIAARLYNATEKVITLDKNGGTGGSDTLTVLQDAVYGDVEIPEKSYTITINYGYGNISEVLTGYAEFGGYFGSYDEATDTYSDEWLDVTGENVNQYTYTGQEITTLIAKWGDAAKITLPTLEREGYRFLGWRTNGVAISENVVDTAMYSEVTAFWIPEFTMK